ncbi:phospholipase D-like domain-containing protein [Endozoicomonas gorgoniicola]|uniref:phospholipase D n=1 Tax=Endozoicomonas gorgoniicola TaxID=1234144 RepID=A0ABT3MYN6_9GAMM|nr:phospholipase D-like domain-containing protein [Endozoicomonas gorgoniicola]MCW7554498.1 phospholipase D-like domain-containing protein [Endozoicomonas gorgoniicola]
MSTLDKIFCKTFSKIVNNRSISLPTLWADYSFQEPVFAVKNLSRVKDSVTEKYAIKNAVLDVINSTKEMLVLCSFLLADEDVEQALLEAEERGVRAYCLIAAEARLDREDPEGEFDRKVLAQHKAMLKRLAGKVKFRTSSSFHAKVVLADPLTSNAKGVLLTANITTDAMQRNEELLLELEEFEVKQLAGYLKWALWEAAEHESIESGSFAAVKSFGGIDHPAESLPVIATTEKRQQISEKALAMIRSAQSEIQVCCFGWDLEHQIVQAIIKKAKLGISVTVFARIRPAAMSALEALAKAGAMVLGFKWLHAKALIVDQQEAMVMSANFQKHGLDEGFELGIVINDDRMEDLLHTFQYWKSNSRWQLHPIAQIGDVLGQIKIWDGKSLNEHDVLRSIDLDLGEKNSISAEEIKGSMPELPPYEKLPYLAHELNCQWLVTAPRLAKGAKQEFKQKVDYDEGKKDGKKKKPKQVPYSPAVYKEPSGRKVIVINSPQQLRAAKRLKDELELSAIVLE